MCPAVLQVPLFKSLQEDTIKEICIALKQLRVMSRDYVRALCLHLPFLPCVQIPAKWRHCFPLETSLLSALARSLS